MRPGDFPAPDGGGRGVNAASGVPLQPPAARRRRSGARAAPSARAYSADGGAGALQRQQLPRRRLGLPAVASGCSGWGRAAQSRGWGARLEAGAAASSSWGGRRRGSGPGPWAPQDARTEPAPGTSNDKPPAHPFPPRTRSGRGAAGTRKTRPGAAARDRQPQPAGAHRGRPENPDWTLLPLASSSPSGKAGRGKATY